MGTHFPDADSRSWTLPASYQDDDVRLSEDVIERYIQRFTSEGDVVFDPFAGFGTVLVVTERLGRIGVGCEVIEDRAKYASSLVSRGRVHVGDVRTIDLGDVRASLVISSPPYMNRGDREDPLSGYRTPVPSYERYVDELASVFTGLSEILEPDGRLVVQLQNPRNARGVTPLAFDLFAAIGDSLQFEGEEITTWDKVCYGYTHGYCLVYSRA